MKIGLLFAKFLVNVLRKNSQLKSNCIWDDFQRRSALILSTTLSYTECDKRKLCTIVL